MKILLVFLVVIQSCVSKQTAHKELDDLWNIFKIKHNKAYLSLKEEQFRRTVWEEQVNFIQQHNLEYDLGFHNYTVGINEYSDWAPEECKKFLLGFKQSTSNSTTGQKFSLNIKGYKLPSQIDWRTQGYVTPIKNQGQCGSCWAFSSTGSLEGQHFRRTGQLVSLSEQNLIDCTKTYGNGGCNGGWMDNSFRYVNANDGLDLEIYYPYEMKDDTCRYQASWRGASCNGFVDIPKGDEMALKTAVATQGPISVAIDANHESFMTYRFGLYFEPKCSTVNADHAVLVVGYGTEDGNDYWLVKNSWGTSWGMNGYIKMARNRENMCAIATYASYPLV